MRICLKMVFRLITMLIIFRIISETPINISMKSPSWKELDQMPWSKDIVEGHWTPPDCHRNYSVAIIIPFRDREEHLRIILNHLHPFLQRQRADYQIFVVEQSPVGIFNKGALSNIGYKIATMIGKASCFIFHDVDMLPIKDYNIYQCLHHPVHLGAAVDKFHYKLVYNSIVGGVLALNSEQFIKVNGYSNIFEGWGGEDDDMAQRMKEEQYHIIRYPLDIGQYKMIEHGSDRGNPPNKKRVKLLEDVKTRYKYDGFQNISINLVNMNPLKSNLMYWITVELPEINYDDSTN